MPRPNETTRKTPTSSYTKEGIFNAREIKRQKQDKALSLSRVLGELLNPKNFRIWKRK